MDSATGRAAMEYAARGWAVFPLVARDKVPAVKGGFKVASTDAESIEEMWSAHPDLNVGIATGSMSGGLIVIDLDVDDARGEDGNATLRAWEREHGELPETATAKTGSGGTHLFFIANEPVGCSVDNELGVDVRGDGGYVVAPPSVHPTGTPYEWDLSPEDVGVARADDNVHAFIRSVQGERRRGEKFRLPESIGEGRRNDTLFRQACSLQSTGYDDDLIYATVETTNRLKCRPPLPDEDVRKIVESALGYEKGAGVRGGVSANGARPGVALMLKANGAPQQTIENCCRVLEADPALAGRVYYDVRAYTRMLALPVPWDDGDGDRAIGDADYCGLAAYMEREHGLMSKQKAIDAVVSVSMRHKRNVVAEWLESLAWDGTERVDWLLTTFLGCDPTDYNAAVMRLFMAGAVARAYEPGTKFDYMPVLVGRQGIGKSMFLRRLGARSEWYCDNLNTIEGDAAAEKLRGMWIIELAELLATKKAKEVEAIKAFVTSTVDTIRPKYARETEQRPRACVFAGTTNDMGFLTDATGNRRFLPVDCGLRDPVKSLFDDDAPAWFEQAWAEAAAKWKAERPRLVLDDRLQAVAIEKQEQYTEDDPRVGIIQSYLDGVLAEWRSGGRAEPRVCAQEIIERALPDGITRNQTKALVNDVHRIVGNRVAGWERLERKARCGSYGVQRCYVPEGCADS